MVHFINIQKAQRQGLTRKRITDKTGKVTTVWIRMQPKEKVDRRQQFSQKEHIIQEGIKGTDTQLRKIAEKRGLKVPPNWTNIWVNKDEKAAMQITGRDGKDRKVYIRSAEHSEKSSAEKFNRLKDFVKDYPVLLNKIKQDINKSEEAKVLYLIAKTGFRVGSEKDTKAKVQAFGATTLTSEHVKIVGDMASFNFIGKKNVNIVQSYKDKVLTQILNKTGKLFNTNDKQVRDYLKKISGAYTPKDFRTYVGTSTALEQIDKIPKPVDEKSRKKAIMLVSKAVAEKLGNTPTVAKQAYISPEVFDIWN